MSTEIALPAAFVLTSSGLEVRGDPSHADWLRAGEALRRAERGVQWAIGDWLNYGEKKYGEKYKEALQTTGLSYQTLRDIKNVSAAFELSRRRDSLPFSTHREVAYIPPEEADALLERAEAEDLSKREVRDLVRRRPVEIAGEAGPTLTVADLARLVGLGHKFGTVYADPPWRYENRATRAAAEDHYGTMSLDELCALPVRELAADESHLWLWTTNAFLFDCPRLFDAWGFEFKSSYVWVKPQMGIGNYLRNSHEFLLLAVRGGLTAAARDVMSWGQFDRTRHSAKPERVRELVVERLSPGPRLELFGRSAVTGWTVWGNQVSRGGLFTEEAGEVA